MFHPEHPEAVNVALTYLGLWVLLVIVLGPFWGTVWMFMLSVAGLAATLED